MLSVLSLTDVNYVYKFNEWCFKHNGCMSERIRMGS